MNERALLRRLQRAGRGEAQVGIGRVPAYGSTMREQLQEEVDRRRDHLAEELLKIMVEDLSWDNSAQLREEIAGDLEAMVKAVIAAATVIHPELPKKRARGEKVEPAIEPKPIVDLMDTLKESLKHQRKGKGGDADLSGPESSRK